VGHDDDDDDIYIIIPLHYNLENGKVIWVPLHHFFLAVNFHNVVTKLGFRKNREEILFYLKLIFFFLPKMCQKNLGKIYLIF